ncbi:DNA topoisomerase [Pediococcus pentosaceus]|uniref:type IA DNA topoisomerase n=1 Tax=Pediococcus pentosaceus TaxID=1255 RepID=UPI0031681F3A
MLLVITEKKDQLEPFAKANDPHAKQVNSNFWIANSNILNTELHLVCASGHLTGLVDPEKYDKALGDRSNYENLPIFPEHYQFEVTSKKNRALLKQIKEESKKADGIILATDPDVEGETIGRLALSKAPGALKKLKYRLWNSSLTINASRKAFQNLLNPEEKASLYQVGLTRQKSDWLVGINISRVAGIKLRQNGYSGAWSVGRVQTPTLALVVQNDLAIKNFKSEPYWEIKARAGNFEFSRTPGYKFEDHSVAQDELDSLSKSVVINHINRKRKRIEAPKLFKLSGVQKEAAALWGYSPKEVMQSIEEMYLKGIMGYPRTDSQVISIDEFNILKDNLAQYKSALGMDFETPNLEPRNRFVVDPSKISGHPALVPTENIPDLNELSDQKRNIYQLITQRAILQFASDFEYDETKIEAVDVNHKNVIWQTIGKKVVNSGWHELVKKQDQDVVLPNLEEGQRLNILPILVQKMTTKPKRYTQGQLIDSVLGKYKLGTEATKADILDTLIDKRKYIKKNKKGELFPTEQGLILYKFMQGTMYVDPEMTSNWEHNLTFIEKKKLTSQEFVKHVEDNIKNTIEEYRNKEVDLSIEPNSSKVAIEEIPKVIECPFCKKGHLILVNGENSKGKWHMYGCSNDSCKKSIPFKLSNYQLSLDDLEKLSRYGKTDEIDKFLGKNGKPFSAYLIKKGSKITFKFK